MYYLIQKNVFKDPRYNEIFRAMETLKLAHEVIEFKPNSHELKVQTQHRDIFVYGSVKLAKIATQYNWVPGPF